MPGCRSQTWLCRPARKKMGPRQRGGGGWHKALVGGGGVWKPRGRPLNPPPLWRAGGGDGKLVATAVLLTVIAGGGGDEGGTEPQGMPSGGR